MTTEPSDDLERLRKELAELRSANAALRLRGHEAEQTIEAIRHAEIESLVLETERGPRVFTLEGASEAYRILVEAMNEGAATVDDDGTILYCNQSFNDIAGGTFEETVGKKLHDLVPPPLMPTVDGLLREARAGHPGRHEVAVVQRGGREITVQISASAADEIARRVVCLVMVDLSEQKRKLALEIEAREAKAREERFRALADAAPAMLWLSDPVGRLTFVSQSWVDFTGIPAAKARQASASGVHPDDRLRLAETFDDAVDRLAPFRVDHRLRHASGEFRWVENAGRPRRGPEGELLGYVGAVTDVHARRELAQERETASERKDLFLAMLGHELRNPLAAMRGAIELIGLVGSGDERAERAQGVVDRQSRHMQRLIDGLLDVSRIERGKIDLEPQRIDFNELARSTADDWSSGIAEARLELRTELPSSPLWVEADRDRLSQVLNNLLANAIEFTEPGGTITVTAVREGESIEARVRDTGAGIEPALLEQIFEPFQQEQQPLARTRGGLGLGLSLVRGLVRLHEGTIHARSEGRGRGTEMVLRLPAAEGPTVLRAKPSKPPESGPRRLLLVEDNVDAAAMLAEVLRLRGHEVDVVHDGEAALAELEAHPVDLVVCDIGLPGVSGHEVARRIRANPAIADIPLVAATGYGRPRDAEEALAAGFDAHLTKPIAIEGLEGVVERLLKKRRDPER